ncbi:uncharacterized protein LOC127725722 isoform X2 [Mytilus californianus]|uniref:uncharacterized protein LOC127725722 isoform X2 n=1 Tax=Mytilus californianus TaxID=6549 RepID=UPI0022453B70|nr:uncharacterized protein LOC127725722 isoform X2 [Mytilus californianus]
MNTSFNQKNDFIVYVYGLKTIFASMGLYNRVVCHGNKEIKCSEEIQVNVSLEECDGDMLLPLSSTATEGVLPVTVHREPPSLYRLDVNRMFLPDKDFIVFIKVKNQIRCYIINGRCVNMAFPFELPSASSVACKVLCACREQRIDGSIWITTTVSHSHVISFKTFLSLLDTYRLYNLAIAFGTRTVYPNLRPIQFFYRNKSKEYFDMIMIQLDGEMRPYLKSYGGEQGSVVNGRLFGLFFSTYLDTTTNMPYPYSHFGPIRLYIQSLEMFNPECNLYFADFYCHKKRHHVTIIVVPKYSIDNEFCGQYLKELNIFHNPYLCLRVEFNGAFTVMANMDVTVEVFYTETINVRRALELQYGFIQKTKTIGRGYAPPSGIPKNPSCKICNLE